MYGIYIDLGFILVAIIFGVIGALKGLLKSVLSIFGLGASIIFVWIFKAHLFIQCEQNFNLVSIFQQKLGVLYGSILIFILLVIMIFLLFKICSCFVKLLFCPIFKIKALSKINQFLGFLFGVVKAVALCCFIFSILNISSFVKYFSINDYCGSSVILLPIIDYVGINAEDVFQFGIDNFLKKNNI